MKKIRTLLVLLVIVFSFQALPVLAAHESMPLVADVLEDGSTEVSDLGDGGVYQEFGDPDDGITGNRGPVNNLGGTAGFSGSLIDGDDADAWFQLQMLLAWLLVAAH